MKPFKITPVVFKYRQPHKWDCNAFRACTVTRALRSTGLVVYENESITEFWRSDAVVWQRASTLIVVNVPVAKKKTEDE